ncbi:Mitochodrial transcription termination factor-related [Macleaya cordata]|uniref:Mitochodrial transcription termination factor-related n=1 Tax=Macleaya cordata TaxID=56857 RepID=A0A200Q1P7_MACCD|nr:Mitochodrial transcription termination factor-related [Macleaya cordata]
MFRVLYKQLLRHHIPTTEPPTTHPFNLYNVVLHHHHHPHRNPHLKSMSGIPESTSPRSFAVEYLINSCGLPPETAYSAAKKLYCLTSADKPDWVLSLLKKHGFTKTQIARLISMDPMFLCPGPYTDLQPKLKYFFDMGVSHSEVADLIASNPVILGWNLWKTNMPVFSFLKRYIGDSAAILTIFKRWPEIVGCNLEVDVKPNIATFQDHGVPDCNIIKFFISTPRTLGLPREDFNETIEVVKKIGIDPSTPTFLSAFRAIALTSKQNWADKWTIWENKFTVFRNLGWSENDILSMFKKNPGCMVGTQRRIRRGLVFFIEKYKWKPSEFLLHPWLLRLSLEKKIIPRCAVFEILKSKGIIGEELKVTSALKVSEKDFIEKYVTKYQEQVPEVKEAYKKGGDEFVGLESQDLEGDVEVV